MTFENFGFDDDTYRSIEEMGFDNPTEIQSESIPMILDGHDVIGGSATGSGKTLAFGAGVIERTSAGDGLQGLILVPTRELAEQVKEELSLIAKYKRHKIIAVYGGVSINPQMDDLKKADIVVATPGRFKDHMQRGTVDMSRITMLVLDEADRMLDMGFIDDIEDIMGACPEEKQTLLFSATIPIEIDELSQKYLHDPVEIRAEGRVDPGKLRQVYYDVPNNMKLSLLVHLIKNEESDLIMVFCNTRRSSDLIVKNLKSNGIDAIVLHGGFTQNKRNVSIEKFKKGKEQVMVCTNVAARGIHIDNISHIYNYEIPDDPNDYIHRIGRTARAGEEGMVINMLSPRDHDNFSRILREYRDLNIERVPVPKVEKLAMKTADAGRDTRRPQRGGRRPGPRNGNNRPGNRNPNKGGFRGNNRSRSSGNRGGNNRFAERNNRR
ncbi:MAG: DEAD/DEAH box helicase [Candidatus Woesearchaeota archaeon]